MTSKHMAKPQLAYSSAAESLPQLQGIHMGSWGIANICLTMQHYLYSALFWVFLSFLACSPCGGRTW